MSVKLLTEHHMEFLSPKGGCTGSSESTLVKITRCSKSHVDAPFDEQLIMKENSCFIVIRSNILYTCA